jgi:hypothetical protein
MTRIMGGILSEMRRATSLALAALLLISVGADATAQTRRRTPAKKPAAAAKKAPAETKCPAVLGTGVKTRRVFCDVLTGRNPAEGTLVIIPPHRGVATLTFDLHNRHTYSEEQIRAKKAFAEYTATIGVLDPKGELLARGVVYSAFRTAADLIDRVDGGAGPGGVKAVAPTGTETIVVSIPQDVTEVSLLGERLLVKTLDGEESFVSAGRPIAVVSNPTVQYTPAPARRTTKKPTR